MRKQKALIIGERGSLLSAMTRVVAENGFIPLPALEANPIDSQLDQHAPSLVICISSHSSIQECLRPLKEIRKVRRTLPVIFVTRQGSKDLAEATLRAGANEYFCFPMSNKSLDTCIQGIIRRQNLLNRHDGGTQADMDTNPESMVGDSLPMREIKSYIARVARTDSTVFITGETGTGKELAAHTIHGLSIRSSYPFVSVNCAALPEHLVESELFGYERGAFTGALRKKPGKFIQAQGGTIFLDEIGEMNTHAQAKLLRCLESREVYPLGGTNPLPYDVRVVAATNKEPEVLMEKGTFREDLYYRINVARVHLPPLREHKEDVEKLVKFAVSKLNRRFYRDVVGFHPEDYRLLQAYGWPGNVRELMNIVEGAFINHSRENGKFLHLPKFFKKLLRESLNFGGDERKRILTALLETKWNKSSAAEKLNWSRMTLYRKMARYHIVEHRRGK
jgi:DNA-binding NtrC family response regulator